MSKNYDYNNGFKWGRRKLFSAFKDEGNVGLHKCDKAAQTCLKYANDKRVTQTKKGVKLTPKLREIYRGIADGILDGYNRLK